MFAPVSVEQGIQIEGQYKALALSVRVLHEAEGCLLAATRVSPPCLVSKHAQHQAIARASTLTQHQAGGMQMLTQEYEGWKRKLLEDLEKGTLHRDGVFGRFSCDPIRPVPRVCRNVVLYMPGEHAPQQEPKHSLLASLHHQEHKFRPQVSRIDS